MGLLFIDVDKMKAINDALGHDAGDDFLCALVERLEHVLRPGDTLARLGGDEFVAICEGLQTVTQAEHVADRMLTALQDPFVVATQSRTASASIGIAIAGEGTAAGDAALARADVAMYEAKRSGGGAHRTAAVVIPA